MAASTEISTVHGSEHWARDRSATAKKASATGKTLQRMTNSEVYVKLSVCSDKTPRIHGERKQDVGGYKNPKTEAL